MNRTTTGKVVHIITLSIIVISFLWMILPMLILRENYCFTIHDGMDSYAGMVQMIHNNHLYFHLNQKLPVMNGLDGKYTFLSYNLYDFLNCIFGYLNGQIITRVIGGFVGFFSLKHLLGYIYSNRTQFQNDLILLLSISYVLTPIASNRTIAFATLPTVIELFLYLRDRDIVSPWVLTGIFLPILSIFDAVFIFILGFWFLFAVAEWIYKRKININIWVAFFLMSISTMIININFIKVALSADDTNRGLSFGEKTVAVFNWSIFKACLQNGQYHSPALHGKILFPILIAGTIYVIFRSMKKVSMMDANQKKSIIILSGGWLFWIISAFVETCQKSGFRTGVLIIDGFQWGRMIGLMRIFWYLMFAAVMFHISERIGKVILYMAICAQIFYVATSTNSYNDTYFSVYNQVVGYKSDKPLISYKDFFSEELFQKVKKDINYSGEGVVAYGYHPSVLLFNSFNTIDGYFSVHSMNWQNEFREIIAPALDESENDRVYYDTWGGRMYIFGPLSYLPSKNKNIEPANLYMDTEAYKRYGGKYILSRAMIANAEDLDIVFINDYDLNDSMYHIYLYSVE